MYCKHCGKQIEDNSQFCKFCGKKLVDTKKVTIEFTKPDLEKSKDYLIKKKEKVAKDFHRLNEKSKEKQIFENVGCILAIIGWILLFCYGVLGCFR